MACSRSVSVINNSASNESRFPNYMTQQSNLSLRATRDRAAGGNGNTVHNASHLETRHTTVAASSGERLVHASGRITSDVTFTAALGDTAAHDRGNTSLQY